MQQVAGRHGRVLGLPALQQRLTGFAAVGAAPRAAAVRHFDAEVLLLEVRAGLPVVEVPVQTRSAARPPHHRTVADPPRIMARVIHRLGRRQPGLNGRSEAHPLGDTPWIG